MSRSRHCATEAAYNAARSARRRPGKFPHDNLGWHVYYVRRFNRAQNPDSAFLAMFYLFAALRDRETT